MFKNISRGSYDLEISCEARETFSEAFGIDVPTQLDVEASLRSWNFSVEGDRIAAGSWDPMSWVNERDTFQEFQQGYYV